MPPPPIPRRQRPAIAGIWHFLLPLLLLLPATLAARQPWWNEEKIITGATPDDYAAANVGQLKNFASRAADAMDKRLQLAGGSGLVITAMINGWKSPSSTLRDDYSALTLGQFKNVLQRFYDRLADVKGVPPAYPWDASSAQAGAADDYAIVNLGQLKRGFDFAIPILLKLSPHSNASIPPAVFEPVRARWLGLDIKPAGSSLNDLDGDGISNGEEYLRSPFPPGKALLDPDDLDGDRIPNDVENEYGLDPLNFEDALSDLDDDGLTNYEECVLLAAEYGTRPDDPLSISQHVDPQTGLPLVPEDCPLTDGQLVLWRRDIARWDFVPGVVGSDGGSNIYPAQAPAAFWDWNDSDQDSVPDGYAAWGLYLSQNSLPAPTRGAAGDLDQDGLPDLWEHRYHLAYWNASDSGHTGGFRGDLMAPYPTIYGNTRRDRIYDITAYLTYNSEESEFQRQMTGWMASEVWRFLPAIQDPDSDHLPNYQEYLAGTSPWLADSDGDGVNDTAELDNGSDPVDVNDSVPFVLTTTAPSASVLIGDTFALQALVTRFTPAQPQADQLVAFEILDGSSARISRGAGQPPVEGVDRRLTGADGRCTVSVIAPTTPGVLQVRIKANKVGAAQTVTIDVQEPEGPPPIVLHIQASTTYPVPENASVPIVVSRRQGGALLAEAGVEIQLTATHGSLGPPALPATPRTAILQTGSDGTASITWQAPAVHLGQLTATLTATSPAVPAGGEAQAALPVVASRTSVASTTSFGSSKLNGSSGGYAGGSSGRPPTQPLRNTSAEAPPVLFTSVRARGGNFSGTDRPKLELDRGGTWKSYKRYVMPKEDEPGDPEPQEPQTAPDDGFDGDLDPKQKTDDPGDPRDSNARTKPWTAPEDEDESADDKHRDATEEEIGSGAAELVHVSYLEEDEDAVGVSSGPEDQESGRYTAFNKYHDLEPLFDPEDEGTPSTYQFNPGQLVSHIKKVEFGKSAAEHGWMGDGFMGVLPVSVGSRYTQEEKEVTLTWKPSREATESETEEVIVHTETASMSWKQVRLQADKAVKAPDGMSVTFLLVKSTFDVPPPGVEPPEDSPAPQIENLGTIILTIPKGETISKKATSTGEASRFIKKESEGDIIDLRQESFTAGKEIVLDLLPVDLAIDANRDGTIASGEAASHDKPFRFWTNSDDDPNTIGDGTESAMTENEKMVPDVNDWRSPTSLLGEIDGLRDLEDFTRLHITLPSDIIQKGASGEAQIGFKWVDGSGPRIRLYKAADVSGGLEYLTDPQKANEQCSGDYYQSVADVNGEQAVYLPASYWQSTTSQGSGKRCFLFEGCEEGTARLATVIKFASGQEASAPGPWIKIMDVRRMFERAKVAPPYAEPSDVPDAWVTGDNPDPVLSHTSDPWGYPFEADPDETTQYIVHVHGWRMEYAETQTWAQTTFKRLWHHGYKGRFAAFRWPTFSAETDPMSELNPINGRLTYNDSEYRAWLSGNALAGYVNSLPSGYTKNVMAHSMGNVVAGAAFRAGMAGVSRYAMFNAAMAHMAYGTTQREYPARSTPDTAADVETNSLGLLNKFNPMTTTAINFYLTQDFAMGAWQFNHALNKPEILPTFFTLRAWSYFPNFPHNVYGGTLTYPPGLDGIGQKMWYNIKTGNAIGVGNLSLTSGRQVAKIPESMAYVAQSRSKPAGNTKFTAGSIRFSESMDDYGFGEEHSAQWVYSVQKSFDCYTTLLRQFGIDAHPN